MAEIYLGGFADEVEAAPVTIDVKLVAEPKVLVADVADVADVAVDLDTPLYSRV